MALKFIKKIYTRAYLFWAVNAFSITIIFFVLNKHTGGGFFLRLFAFFFCLIVGGLLGMFWSIKRKTDAIKSFRIASGTFLMIFSLLMWSNNKYGGVDIDCSGDKNEYSDGYTHGQIISYAIDSHKTSCQEYIYKMANEGVNLNNSDCFCKGYYDGKSNRRNKYE